ncbi:MAG: hypothetical protein C0595_14360 [Marinilabiliales bacterium]|nr:MAG: hypothetical protein C0595_14360 [Marinilabiliales bacterium]
MNSVIERRRSEKSPERYFVVLKLWEISPQILRFTPNFRRNDNNDIFCYRLTIFTVKKSLIKLIFVNLQSQKLKEMFLKILLLTVGLLALAFAGFAVKMFFKKDGEFKKQCSSVDPQTGLALGCSCEGSPGDGSCRKDNNGDGGKQVHPGQLVEVASMEIK